MLEAYQTGKGVGIVASDEGRERGPYTVRVLLDGGKAVIRTANPARQRARTISDARAWLRAKLGPLRKGNPSRISKLMDEAEAAGEQWGRQYKARKGGGRAPSNDVLYQMGREYSGDVLASQGPLPTGHRELIAMQYKAGVRRGVRNPGGLTQGGLYAGHNSGYSWIEWQRAILDAIPRKYAQPYYSLGVKAMPQEAIAVITNEYRRGLGPADVPMVAAMVESLLRYDMDKLSAATPAYYKKQIQYSLKRQAKGLSRYEGIYPDVRDMETMGLVKRTKVNNPGLLDPTGASLYESFHGKPSTKVATVKQVTYSREDLSQLGILVSLKVHLVTAQRAEIEFSTEGDDRVLLASSPDGRQLYFIGGDQTIDLQRLGLGSAKWYRDMMVLGVCTEVTYRTRKGFDQFQLIDYYHALGEETGDKPQLLYDTINDELSIAGGQYQVKPEGIVN